MRKLNKLLQPIGRRSNSNLQNALRIDMIGPPDPISNLRPILFAKCKDETSLERRYRKAREDTQLWNQNFWRKHNLKFIEERKQFQESLKTQDKTLSADQMSVFYKQFLDKNWETHFKYNIAWYKKNLVLLFLEGYNYYVHWNILFCWAFILWTALCLTDLYRSDQLYVNREYKSTSFPYFANIAKEDGRSTISELQITEERIDHIENSARPSTNDYSLGNNFAQSKMIILTIEIFVFVCLISIVAYAQCQLKSTDTNSTLTFCVHNAKVSSKYYSDEKNVEHSYNELIYESSLKGHSTIVSGLLEQMSRCIAQEVKDTLLDREQSDLAKKKSTVAPLSSIKLKEDDKDTEKSSESRQIDKTRIISSSPAFQEFLSNLRNSRSPYTCTPCKESIVVKDSVKVYSR
ncbi:hypothetical protein KM043_009009 [Ampulex compressa]|nr:hypothetical protein KM043_009009 [Ampulex compressa]